MQIEAVRADNFTFPFVIKACTGSYSLVDGQKLHSKLIKVGLETDVYVCNSLIVMYAELGRIESAEKVFNEMAITDLVSWNSMVAGYVSAGDGWKSLVCFGEMLSLGLKPDYFGVMSALAACALGRYLLNGKEIHRQLIVGEFKRDYLIEVSVLDMYCKCGRMDYAERTFDGISQHNVVAWNAMIGGYAQNGKPAKAFDCLIKMQVASEANPDAITVINLLSCCLQLGGLRQGKYIHGFSIRRGFLPRVVLETALVNMYGKCRVTKLAEWVFSHMKQKNLVSWNAMIAAYVQNDQNTKAVELFKTSGMDHSNQMRLQFPACFLLVRK